MAPEVKFQKLRLSKKHVHKSKKNYYSNQIDKYTNSAKKQWKIINEIISNSKPKNKVSKLKLPDSTITDSKDIAEAFNSYFCSVAGKLKDEIPSSNHRFLPNFKHVHNSIFLKPCTETEISDIVKNLKTIQLPLTTTRLFSSESSSLPNSLKSFVKQ